MYAGTLYIHSNLGPYKLDCLQNYTLTCVDQVYCCCCYIYIQMGYAYASKALVPSCTQSTNVEFSAWITLLGNYLIGHCSFNQIFTLIVTTVPHFDTYSVKQNGGKLHV